MRRLFKNIYIFFIYCIQFVVYFMWTKNSESLTLGGLLEWVLIFTFISVFFMVVSVILSLKENKDRKYLKSVMIRKISVVPFFIINFALWLLISVIMMLPGGQFIIFVMPFAVGFAFLLMITTSIQTVLYIWFGDFGKKGRVFHTIMQFIFVVDVIDTIYIYFSKRNN